jgi:ABC-type uncharacterized transport system permease subunit
VSALLQALTVQLPPLYLVAALLHGMSFAGERAPRVVGWRRCVAGLLLVLHGAWFVVYAERVQAFPVDDLGSTISAVVLCTFVLQLVLSRWTGHGGSSAIVLSILACAQVVAASVSDLRALPHTGSDHVFGIVHIATSVLALAALVLSGIHGLLYLVLLRQMKERTFGVLFRGLPHLDILARMTRGAALAGFVGLTVGLNVGIALAHMEYESGFRYRAAEVAFSIFLWLYFGGIALSVFIRGFNARRASWAAAAGLALLILSLVLALIPGSTFHSRL